MCQVFTDHVFAGSSQKIHCDNLCTRAIPELIVGADQQIDTGDGGSREP